MQPEIALLLYILFILYIFRMDFKRKSNVSNALWIPLIWMIITGSRLVSQWLNIGSPVDQQEAYSDGNSLDRFIFSILIILGLFILSRRKMYWSKILKNNVWILLLFVYGGISILWSDFPMVSFRRWIKVVGSLVMILVVLTESDPAEAAKTIFRRFTYVLIPLSIVLIKYYPQLGTEYSFWTGQKYYTGVTTGKNALGNLASICTFFLFWSVLTSTHKKELPFNILFLAMTMWLLNLSNSATSLMTLIIGSCILLGTLLPAIKRNVKYVGTYIIVTVLFFAILQISFDIMSPLIAGLGRDKTFTGRVDLWNDVIDMRTNVLIGTGYESFWLGDRLSKLWKKYWWHPNQAHNGYLEIFLNQGLIGLILFVCVIISAYRNSKKELMFNFDYGRLKMGLLFMCLFYNITEASFKGLNLIFFVFILISANVPRHNNQPVASLTKFKSYTSQKLYTGIRGDPRDIPY